VRLLALLLVVAAAACGNAGPLADIDVTSASLSKLDWTSVDAVVGLTESDGVLTVVDTGGASHSVNISISGPAIGLLFDIAGSSSNDPNNCLVQNSGSLTLPKGKQLKGSDLVGGYGGNEEAIGLGLNGTSHDLTNTAGVRLEGGAVNFGMGMMVAFEWLSITAK
jgi:hypothetical protein